jgi:hypothetical protein
LDWREGLCQIELAQTSGICVFANLFLAEFVHGFVTKEPIDLIFFATIPFTDG